MKNRKQNPLICQISQNMMKYTIVKNVILKQLTKVVYTAIQ